MVTGIGLLFLTVTYMFIIATGTPAFSAVPLRHLGMRKSEVLHVVLDQYRQIVVYHYLKML